MRNHEIIDDVLYEVEIEESSTNILIDSEQSDSPLIGHESP